MQGSQAQAASEVLGELTSPSRPEKIEVSSRVAEDGSTLLELVEYSWGSGLGWYVQKRLTLDAAQVEALRSLLGTEQIELPAPTLRRSRPAVQQDGNVTRLLFG